MSFLNQLRVSVEGANLYDGPVTALEEMEAEEAMTQYEEGIAETDNNLEQVERAEAVVDELENTNEAIQGAVARDAFTPEVAAMAEAQRRTAAAALNLNPEEGAGAELVDQAGLEAMVNNPGTVSLEASKSMIEKIKDFIKDIIDKIKAGWEKFKDILGRIFKVLPSHLKSLIEFFNDKKAVDAAKKWVSELKEEDKDIFKALPYAPDDNAYGLHPDTAKFVENAVKVIKETSDAKSRADYSNIISRYPNTGVSGHYFFFEVKPIDDRIEVRTREVVGKGFVEDLNVETFVKVLKTAESKLKTISDDNKFGKSILATLNSIALKVVDSKKETEDMSWMRVRMINTMKHSNIMDTIRKDSLKALRALASVGDKLRKGAESNLNSSPKPGKAK